MNKSNEQYIEHEVRIRIQEANAIELRNDAKELRAELKSQFKWLIGTMISLFGGLIITKFFH